LKCIEIISDLNRTATAIFALNFFEKSLEKNQVRRIEKNSKEPGFF
jgi:hypothetical protein